MCSCIWPTACSVVYSRGHEDLVPTLTAPEPLHSARRDKIGAGILPSDALARRSSVAGISPRCSTVCARAPARVYACELHLHMPSHGFSFVNPPLLLLPSSFPFHLCAPSLWMTAWLQSFSPPQPNLSKPGFTTAQSLHKAPQ